LIDLAGILQHADVKFLLIDNILKICSNLTSLYLPMYAKFKP